MTDVDRQAETISLMRQVLGESYTHLVVKRVVIEENMEEQTASVSCEVVNPVTSDSSVIGGKGSGAINAFFNGVVDRFATEYPSLKTIRFSSFAVRARLDTKNEYAGTDSLAEVTVEIRNSEDRRFTFTHTSRSVIGSGLITTLAALEYFINSERAFVAIYHALRDAQERKRSDLIQRYTNSMATLVENTSYSEVISRIRQQLG